MTLNKLGKMKLIETLHFLVQRKVVLIITAYNLP